MQKHRVFQHFYNFIIHLYWYIQKKKKGDKLKVTTMLDNIGIE